MLLIIFPFQKNRPFNTQNIVDILHQTIKKTAAQRALDSLVSSNQIATKEFGKTKLYFADQSQFQAPSEDQVREEMETISSTQSTLYDLEATKKAMEQGLFIFIPDPLFRLSSLMNIFLINLSP